MRLPLDACRGGAPSRRPARRCPSHGPCAERLPLDARRGGVVVNQKTQAERMCLPRPDFFNQLVVATSSPLAAGTALLLYSYVLQMQERRWEHARGRRFDDPPSAGVEISTAGLFHVPAAHLLRLPRGEPDGLPGVVSASKSSECVRLFSTLVEGPRASCVLYAFSSRPIVSSSRRGRHACTNPPSVGLLLRLGL